MTKEVWKDVIGYEGLYQVSNLGNVNSLERKITKNGVKMTLKERLLKPTLSGVNGYLRVGLTKDKKTKIVSVHKLVATAFLGHTSNGFTLLVDHIDRNPLNNNVDNLREATPRENSANRKNKSKHGTGVYRSRDRFQAVISINGKLTHLGVFKTKEAASKAYQDAASNIIHLPVLA